MIRVLVVSLLLCVGGAWANDAPEMTSPLIDGQEVLQVTTGLLRYQFLKNSGVLRSAYVHFSTYGSNPIETVPGWMGTALAPGVSLPFEVWLGDTPVSESHTVRAESDPHGSLTLVFSSETANLKVQKEFILAKDALYTGKFAISVEGKGVVRVVLGHLPAGQNAPELVYLYDGKVQKAPLAPGAYTRFQGLGLVGKDTVFFFRIDEGEAQPFLARNTAGQPLFGIEGQETLRVRGIFYTGRNRYVLLTDAGLGPLAKSGAFTTLLVGVIRFFEWLYRLTGNYGWAIILFTIITRIVLYPLMRNQYRSIAKMQKLAPKIKKIQERFKDDREALQRQLMELYRQEKVNPLGGCLPLLLQFPILILLWQAIMYSAEKIHLSPGFLWIADLSKPDPYYLLVILGTGVQVLYTWYTQRRMPEQAPGGSQFLGYVFPLVMAVLFLSFPAGLWLYWTFTTLVQFGQQLIIDWEIAREEARQAVQPGKDGGENL
ncbi:MAG: YidC/Oxa1 family membrane protein insertase [Candidatus Bipolaricaulota bacterium]|nr:YidC/Oxa1 family membrane protein insertase [Candidatus Bipolaricaulota bacterium]MDW8126746.1 YidC/Oxa1 family membrane protein insertase [Candidatus Bipolaricaulota bacterium]